MSLKALFIKSPFKYMELSGDTILAEKDLLGFDSFKRVVLALREEKGFHNSEADTLFHFVVLSQAWLFYQKSSIGTNFSQASLRLLLGEMLDIYIKGENA